MKRALMTAAATLLLVITAALAQLKPCDELKSEIEEKVKKNGVHTFTLDIVGKDEAAKPEASKEGDAKEGGAGQGTVVGTCEGGTKQILYRK